MLVLMGLQFTLWILLLQQVVNSAHNRDEQRLVSNIIVVCLLRCNGDVHVLEAGLVVVRVRTHQRLDRQQHGGQPFG